MGGESPPLNPPPSIGAGLGLRLSQEDIFRQVQASKTGTSNRVSVIRSRWGRGNPGRQLLGQALHACRLKSVRNLGVVVRR